MKHKYLLLISVIALVFGIIAASCAAPTPSTVPTTSAPPTTPSPEKVFTWKLSSTSVEADADWYINVKGFKDAVEEASGGKVLVDIFPAAQLVDPNSQVDACMKGAIDVTEHIAGLAAEIVPTALGSEMPYGCFNGEQSYKVHNEVLLPIQQKDYNSKNMYLVAWGPNGDLCFESTFPVNKVDDFKGKKIFSIPNCIWLANFGAALTDVPGLDMYMGLKLGTIDGLTWTTDTLEFANFKEVVKYVMFPILLRPTTHFSVNMDRWNEIGPDLQKKIQDGVNNHLMDWSRAYDDLCKKSYDASVKYGVKLNTLPDSEVAKMKVAANDFWKEVAGMSPSAAEMIDKYRAWQKANGI